MNRFQNSIATAALVAGSLMMAFSLAGCGGGNFETDEPHTEAEGEELEAMEESPGEQAN